MKAKINLKKLSDLLDEKNLDNLIWRSFYLYNDSMKGIYTDVNTDLLVLKSWKVESCKIQVDADM